MKTLNITVAADLVSKIEAAGYEFEARKDIVKEMLASDMDTKTEAFVRYQKELVQYKAEFELLKGEFEANVVKELYPEAVRWNLTYGNCLLTVEVPDDAAES